jgi:hypothetical protein
MARLHRSQSLSLTTTINADDIYDFDYDQMFIPCLTMTI